MELTAVLAVLAGFFSFLVSKRLARAILAQPDLDIWRLRRTSRRERLRHEMGHVVAIRIVAVGAIVYGVWRQLRLLR